MLGGFEMFGAGRLKALVRAADCPPSDRKA